MSVRACMIGIPIQFWTTIYGVIHRAHLQHLRRPCIGPVSSYYYIRVIYYKLITLRWRVRRGSSEPRHVRDDDNVIYHKQRPPYVKRAKIISCRYLYMYFRNTRAIIVDRCTIMLPHTSNNSSIIATIQ